MGKSQKHFIPCLLDFFNTQAQYPRELGNYPTFADTFIVYTVYTYYRTNNNTPAKTYMDTQNDGLKKV